MRDLVASSFALRSCSVDARMITIHAQACILEQCAPHAKNIAAPDWTKVAQGYKDYTAGCIDAFDSIIDTRPELIVCGQAQSLGK